MSIESKNGSKERLKKTIKSFSDGIFGLFDEIEKRNREMSESLESAQEKMFPVVLAFVQMLEGRDEFTYGHSRRVAANCVRLACYLKWPVERIRLLNFAALLHDIGTIIIPDSILHKDGKYTTFEYETMKLHSSTGNRILSRLEFIGREIPEWVLHHHERYDGEGYPDGLAGDMIPIGARIIALADSYDAMTTPRRYRQKIEHWMALDEIVRCGGRQFDPDLAVDFQEAMSIPPTKDESFSKTAFNRG